MSDVITVTASRAKVTTSDTDALIQDGEEGHSAVILSSAMKETALRVQVSNLH